MTPTYPDPNTFGANDLPAGAREALAEILNRPDPDLVGILLTGSAGRGMATQRSDIDIWTIYDRDMPFAVDRRPFVDEIRAPMSGWKPGEFGSDGWYQRWQFAWPLILRDTPDGWVARAARAHATVSGDEQWEIISHCLGGYINFTYRAMKSHRDSRILERNLDARESIPWLLDTIFPLYGRVRPYNKYLAWELREHPLPAPGWSVETFIPQLEAITAGDVDAMRDVFSLVERECDAFDAAHDSGRLRFEIDDWGDDHLDDLRRR